VVEEGPDIGGVEEARMGGVVEANEADDPPHIRPLGVKAVMPPSAGGADAVEETRRSGGRERHEGSGNRSSGRGWIDPSRSGT
jgi:uncharacterized membrane protein